MERNLQMKRYWTLDITQGDMQLSEHFKASEFRCKDNSNFVFIDNELLQVLETVRSHFNKPVIINSGYRTPTYNEKIGGAKHSQHCLGKASDIYITGIAPKEIYNFLDSLYPLKYGLGLYNTFIHIDTRDKKSRWQG